MLVRAGPVSPDRDIDRAIRERQGERAAGHERAPRRRVRRGGARRVRRGEHMTFDEMFPLDRPDLDGFELHLVGFDCLGEIEYPNPWGCPFTPGCGAATSTDCPLMRRRVLVARGTLM